MLACSNDDCLCCQHATTKQQLMLEEINTYRKLFRQPPISESDVGSITGPLKPLLHIPKGSTVREPYTLQTLPPEVLDNIFSFIRTGPIFPICHSIRQFKYISKAIHDVAIAFPRYYNRSTSLLWPDFHFPCGSIDTQDLAGDTTSIDDTSESTDNYHTHIPMATILQVHALTKLVSYHGGVGIIVPSSSTLLDNIIPLLPKVIDVKVPVQYYSSTEYHKFLQKLGESKTLIRMLHLPVLDFNEDGTTEPTILETLQTLPIKRIGTSFLPTDFAVSLPKFKNLCELQLQNAKSFPYEVLARCKRLETLTFVDVFGWGDEEFDKLGIVLGTILPQEIKATTADSDQVDAEALAKLPPEVQTIIDENIPDFRMPS
ncbi:UNVERIFIED_CONTAM: hypothetical protein HDU68_009362, partial [Siphonaria sp. JEL0065]